MSCKPICKLCKRLVLSTAVTYVAPYLVIVLPAGSYNNNEKYCIVVAQSIPAETPLDAQVVIKIGAGTDAIYNLVSCDCSQVVARAIRTRTKYCTIVKTNATTGIFRLIGKICKCCMSDELNSINGTI